MRTPCVATSKTRPAEDLRHRECVLSHATLIISRLSSAQTEPFRIPAYSSVRSVSRGAQNIARLNTVSPKTSNVEHPRNRARVAADAALSIARLGSSCPKTIKYPHTRACVMADAALIIARLNAAFLKKSFVEHPCNRACVLADAGIDCRTTGLRVSQNKSRRTPA